MAATAALVLLPVLVLAFGAGCSSGSDPASGSGAGPAPGPSQTNAAAPAPAPSSVEVDGRTVAMPCSGDGDQAVVFLAGGSDPGSIWDEVVGRLGADVLTCRYDTPGVGGSDPWSEPVTASRLADGLDAVLTAAGLDGPVVVVAHSLSGQVARQFGARHPGDLAGTVLIDPTTRLAMFSLRDELTGRGWDVDAAIAEADAPVMWPAGPLVVLSHDPARNDLGSPEIEQLWAEGQAEYAALTPSARHEVVDGAGHYVQRDDPERVASTIREVLAEV